jgi:diamine N-acetyltransferase
LGIILQEITRDNWLPCVRLKVAPDQEKYVASNAVSLAQSKYEPESVPLAIYDGDTMVGFVMYHPEDYGLSKIWFIERLMVGQHFQGKGYGRAGMEALIARLKAIPGYNAILISFIPDNAAAQKLYVSLGFKDTGEIEEGEVVYRLAI